MTAYAIPTNICIPDDVRARISVNLDEAATHRQRQLDVLQASGPDAGADVDPVVSAQRATLRQLLKQITAARARLDDEDFGRCEVCQASIPVARLEIRPWTSTCVTCAAS